VLNVKYILSKRSPFTRLEKDEVQQEVNVDMLNVKRDTVDKNSQN
jgi:hypothetical protein